MTDGAYFYVAFEVKQRTTVQATQHTNDVGAGVDDVVSFFVWPDGTDGFKYHFLSNAIGTHYQRSSENNTYAPTWQSAGHVTRDGFSVSMKIPLSAIRGGGAQPWRVQFSRDVISTHDLYVWSYDAAQQDDEDVLYAGYLRGLQARGGGVRAKPRVGIYGLASIASANAGGSTSRAGVDLSVPLTKSASFIATFHPDFSNVESDQQTIAPTAYRRFYNEVRPFFAQGASFYNNFSCVGCPGIQELYTPAIPTPREGYAVEGKQGPLDFAAFDAVGAGRIDAAQSVGVHSKDLKNSFQIQRVAVDLPGIKDDTVLYGATHNSLRGLLEYVNYGEENGTLVTDRSRGKRLDVGVGAYSKDAFAGASIRKIGAQYSPYDGFVEHSDIAGYQANVSKTWYFNSSGRIPRVIFEAFLDRYHDSTGSLNQTDNQIAAGWDFQQIFHSAKVWHARVQAGSSYLRLSDGTFTPVSQNGIELSYAYRTATPIALSYYTGRFGAGYLDSWTRSAGFRIGNRGTLFAEANDTIHRLDDRRRYVQWLERLTYSYQNGSDSSFAVGVRRIIGTSPLLLGPPVFSTGWNLSAAFHQRLPHDELYLVYGDASSFSTAPAAIVKFIHYIGAEKGT